MTVTDPAALLPPLADAAREAGALLLRTPPPGPATDVEGFRRAFDAAEAPLLALLRERLGALRPGVPWAEELDQRVPDRGELWVVDAIDGAVQYLQGLPQFCVSATLVRDGEAVATALHAPLLGTGGAGETCTAAAGAGALRDGVPIGPGAKTDPAAALVATSHPPFLGAREPELAEPTGRALAAVLPLVGAVRNLGPTSWQLADVATGRLDAFWQLGQDDGNLLGGVLIAREAGALATDWHGQPWRAGARSVLVAGPGLHRRLLTPLRAAVPPTAGGACEQTARTAQPG
ncbi:inositol monophosphatase family protein [Streptacidiphilus melanogenes]|uniref:inositol monophosphatase family protein n=1 Tax=Streptacidiphilus melanogenes TaxID=411235 RepID=UPI0005A7767C|nr:inositol monophosphatase family protein [Streptacidiphilus melanogenes]